jgi:hypothetical protein
MPLVHFASRFLRPLFASLALGLVLTAEVSSEEARMGLFSVTLPIIAIFGDDLFVGEVVASIARRGNIEVRSVLDATRKCAGSFRYTELNAGVADMRCDDGTAARLQFNGLSAFSGYGYGSTPKGPASFTFGLKPQEAMSHLKLPPGRKLVETVDGLRLESGSS